MGVVHCRRPSSLNVVGGSARQGNIRSGTNRSNWIEGWSNRICYVDRSSSCTTVVISKGNRSRSKSYGCHQTCIGYGRYRRVARYPRTINIWVSIGGQLRGCTGAKDGISCEGRVGIHVHNHLIGIRTTVRIRPCHSVRCRSVGNKGHAVAHAIIPAVGAAPCCA